MRMLTVAEQVRLASVKVLRGVFAGIGQLLLAADRLKAEEAAEAERADANGSQDPLGAWERRAAEAAASAPAAAESTAAEPTAAEPTAAEPTAAGPEVPAATSEPPAGQDRPERPQARSARRPVMSKPTHAATSDHARTRGRSGPPRRKQSPARPVVEQPQRRSGDSTGNVRLLTSAEFAELSAADPAAPAPPPDAPAATTPGQPAPQEAAPGKRTPARAARAKASPTEAAPAKTSPAKPAPAKTSPAKTSPAKTSPAKTSPAKAAAPAPIPGYDGLSLASLRARLRGLSADQLVALVDYEKSHADRGDVVTMFERRLAKLQTGEH